MIVAIESIEGVDFQFHDDGHDKLPRRVLHLRYLDKYEDLTEYAPFDGGSGLVAVPAENGRFEIAVAHLWVEIPATTGTFEQFVDRLLVYAEGGDPLPFPGVTS